MLKFNIFNFLLFYYLRQNTPMMSTTFFFIEVITFCIFASTYAMSSLNGSGTKHIGLSGPQDQLIFSNNQLTGYSHTNTVSEDLLEIFHHQIFNELGIDTKLSMTYDTMLMEVRHQVSHLKTAYSNYDTIITASKARRDDRLVEKEKAESSSDIPLVEASMNEFHKTLENMPALIDIYEKAYRASKVFYKSFLLKINALTEARKAKNDRFTEIVEGTSDMFVLSKEMTPKYQIPCDKAGDFITGHSESMVYVEDDEVEVLQKYISLLKIPHYRFSDRSNDTSTMMVSLTKFGAYVINVVLPGVDENEIKGTIEEGIYVDNTDNTHFYCFPPSILLSRAMEMISNYYQHSFDKPGQVVKKYSAVFNVAQGERMAPFTIKAPLYRFFM